MSNPPSSSSSPIKRLVQAFAAPVFADEEQNRIAGHLNTVLVSLMALMPVLFVAGLFGTVDVPGLVLSAVTFALVLGMRFLLLRRRVRLAGNLLLIVILVNVTAALYAAGTIRIPIASAYVVGVVAAGLLVSHRAAVVYAILSALALLGLTQAEMTGALPPATITTGITQWITYAATLSVTAVLLTLTGGSIRTALDRARRNEQLQKEANRQLEELRASLEDTIARRTAQLQVSAEVSRAVTSVLDPDDLIRRVAHLISDRFGYYYAAVFLVDDVGKVAVLREATGEAGKLLRLSGHRLEVGGQSMVGAAITTRKPRVAERVADEPVRFANPLLPDTRSEVALPLVVGDVALGALDVQSTLPDAFDASALAVLQNLADQIAIAIDNARQFQNAQQDARLATALFEASRLAGFITEDLASATDHLMTTVAAQAGFDGWLAVAYDEDSAACALLSGFDALTNAPIPRVGQVVRMEAAGELPFAQAIRLRQPVVITDPGSDPRLSALSPEARRGLSKMVSVPAELGGRVVGAVTLSRSTRSADITARDVQLAQAISNQLAVTVENRRLFAQAHQAVTDLEDLMQRYTREGWTQFAKTRAPVVEREFSRPGSPPIHPDVLPKLEEAARADAAQPIPFDGQTAVAIPITLRGEVIGTLAAQDARDRRWTEDEVATLRAVADQVAQSLEAARLLDETEITLRETTALYQASRSMATATAPDEVMHIGVTAIRDRLGADQVRLTLFDEVLGYGIVAAEAVPTPHAVTLQVPMAGSPVYETLQETRKPIVICDVDDDPLLGQAMSAMVREAGCRAVLLLPLLVGPRLIGWVGAGMAAPYAFAEPEIVFCETLARQAAVAIENRRLFEETRRRAELETALNRISQTIKASIDPQTVLDLQATMSEMGRALQAGRAFYLANDDDQRLVYAYEWCAPGVASLRGTSATWADLAQTFRALREGRSLIVSSVEREDPAELRPLMRRYGVQAHLHVPVLTGNRLMGVLGFDQTDRERRWTPEEAGMVQRVADQLAAALENARLYQNVRSRVNELTALTRIGRRLAASLQLEDVLNTIVEEALNVTPADRGSIALHDPLQDALEMRVIIGYPDAARRMINENSYGLLRRGDGLHGRLLVTGQAVLSNDVLNDPTYLPVDSETRSELIVPIQQGETLLGALNLESPRAYAFSESDQRLIEALADQAAVAIVNARAYESERAALERMRDVDRLKTQFLANMSHELRTPLNSIIGFSRVILRGIDGPLTELQQADLSAIHNSGQHLLGLINDILDLSKIEAGKMELAVEEVDLAEVIKGVMSTAIALVKDKKVELRQEAPSSLPPVRADARRIRQVVLNLVSNAAKFTEQGHILTRVKVLPTEVHISVSDTGIGIPADKQEHIFEEFTQVDASTTRKAGGTGLGLAISRRFIEMHGGRIWVESQMGVGSTFTCTLPLRRPEDGPREEPPAEAAVPLPGAKVVLCIDDDAGVITLYHRYLEKRGFQVIGLRDASRAVEEAKRLKPFAITLDVLMPNRDGWSVLADLKSDRETSGIPIVVCSIVEDEGKGFALGAADYLVKPIGESDLMRALSQIGAGRPVQTVLVIDDEDAAVRLIRRMLDGRPGVRVLEAHSGALGIATAQSARPDVVLLDLMMPDIDGFAVLETLKGNRLSRDIPVIIVTAKDLSDDDRARLRGRAAALLNKGAFDAQRLMTEIAGALGHLAAEPTSSGSAAPSVEETNRVVTRGL